MFLTFAGTGLREVNFFGDLNDSQATVIANNLGHDAEELLRTELGRGLNDSNISTKELILRSTSYPIRKYTNSLADGYRGQAIKTLREALGTSKGVVGEWWDTENLQCDLSSDPLFCLEFITIARKILPARDMIEPKRKGVYIIFILGTILSYFIITCRCLAQRATSLSLHTCTVMCHPL